MKKVVLGHKHFQLNFFNNRINLFSKLSNEQNPEVLFITCSDSRIDPNLLTNSEPGELFIIRNAGNIIPPHTNSACGFAASIEFAINAIGVKHVVVCGHSDCGAMKGVLDKSKIKNLPDVQKWLDFAQPALDKLHAKSNNPKSSDILQLTQCNVLVQIQNLMTHPCVIENTKNGCIDIHGWIYDIGKGHIKVFDKSINLFVPIEKYYVDFIN